MSYLMLQNTESSAMSTYDSEEKYSVSLEMIATKKVTANSSL